MPHRAFLRSALINGEHACLRARVSPTAPTRDPKGTGCCAARIAGANIVKIRKRAGAGSPRTRPVPARDAVVPAVAAVREDSEQLNGAVALPATTDGNEIEVRKGAAAKRDREFDCLVY